MRSPFANLDVGALVGHLSQYTTPPVCTSRSGYFWVRTTITITPLTSDFSGYIAEARPQPLLFFFLQQPLSYALTQQYGRSAITVF